MTTIPISNGLTLSVDSSYDSGMHRGFVLQGFSGENGYGGFQHSLDELLTKEEIRSLEVTLIAVACKFLESKKV